MDWLLGVFAVPFLYLHVFLISFPVLFLFTISIISLLFLFRPLIHLAFFFRLPQSFRHFPLAPSDQLSSPLFLPILNFHGHEDLIPTLSRTSS